MDVAPAAVMERMGDLGFDEVVDEDSAFDTLVRLYNEQDFETLVDCVSVPLDVEMIPEEYHVSLVEAARKNSDKAQTKGFNFLGQEMDATNILGAIAGGMSGLFQGGATNIGTSAQQQQLLFQQQQLAEQQRRDSNRKMYTILIVLAIAGIAFFIWKSKKG